ncbi:MAG: hypothetical protein J7K64_01135 [Bacteroidales bacterium]|nr:hypothetical protein [Bacteroidales bacterium]
MKKTKINTQTLKFILINFLMILTLISLVSNQEAKARTKGAPYTSSTVASGEWTDAANWDQTTAPDPSSNKCDLTFNHDITYNPTGTAPWTNPFIWDNNITLYIAADVIVTINSDLSIKNNFTITIEPGGQLIINGNMDIQNNVVGTIDGSIYITGDLTVAGGGHSDISGTGEIVVDGTITDDNNVVIPNLTTSINRWLIVDNGNWDVPESWSSSSKGSAAVSIPNKQCIVHIETSYTGYLNINSEIDKLDIKTGAKLNINPTKTLTVQTDITNNGNIEINSDASGTGGLIFNGVTAVSATCKRYITANEYHYVSSPMTAAPVSSYNVTSGGYTNPNFYYYDETETNTDWMYGWKQANSGNIELGKGYALYTDENYAYSLQGGNLQNQDFNVPITNTTSAGSSKSWNLIGNPFPCNVNADTFITVNNTSSVFTGSLYFWDDDGSGSLDYTSSDYLVYTLGGGTTGGNGTVFNKIIAPLQGFFVQAVNTGGNLSFTSTAKTVTNAAFLKGSEKNQTTNSDNLEMIHLSMSNPNGLFNDILLKFTDNADEGIDIYDGLKLKGNQNIAFFSMLDEDEYAIQGFPNNFNIRIIKLGWDISVAGDYTIKAEDFINFPENIKILLLDNETGNYINLREKSYTFNTFGKETNRISLILNNLLNSAEEVSDISDFDTSKIMTSGNTVFINNITNPSVVYYYDLSGKLVGTKNLTVGSNQFSITGSSGYYIVKIVDSKSVNNYKIFIN